MGRARSISRPKFLWVITPLAALVAFLPSLWAGYLADDFVMLQTTKLLHLPQQAFTHTDIGGTSNHPYRPIWVLASGMINWATSESAVAHHVVNVLLYIATSALVVVIAGRFVERSAAVLAGVVYAIYPRHAESVAWISGSTDVLAGFLSLVALVALTTPKAPRWALVVAVVVGATAPLAKESAFALPALAILLVVALWPADAAPVRRRRAVATAAMTVGVVGDLVLRTVVIHGLGNDVTEPFGIHRLVVVVASQILATFTTSQMLVLQHKALLAIPLLFAALVLIGAVQTLRSRDQARQRLLVVGVIWFLISLVPIYNNAVDLNSSNGERLLYLPSVGTALAIAAVAARLLKMRLGQVALALGAVAATVACLGASWDYVTAGSIRARVVADTIRLAPRNATVVALNTPDSYRSARLLGAGYAQAVARAGRPDLNLLVCVPTIIQTREAQDVHFTIQPGGEVLAQSTTSLPFDTPESGRGISTSGCLYHPATAGKIAPGLGTSVALQLVPTGTNTVYLWFDGVDMRACNPVVCAGIVKPTPH